MKMPSSEELVAAVTGILSIETPPTEAEIDAALDRMATAFGADADAHAEARRHLHANFKLRMQLGVTLTAADEHEQWLAARRGEIDPFYWTRYRRLLVRKGWGPLVVDTLDRSTDELLDLLGDPADSAGWKRRGLVVGDVQSGKTASYAALICKAADAGYRMIILLTGTLENVRRQTQERLDESFVGLDSRDFLTGPKTQRKNHVGVGLIDSKRDGIVFTSQDHDFRKNAANALNISLAAVKEPVLVVSKKNKGVLNRLADWLRARNADGDGRIDLPLLMIDDEADNASINTKKDPSETTAINKAIRDLLSIFRRSSYVGFTATPFANIFIDPKSTDDMLGDDLFPHDFIHVLEPPSNYWGMERLFDAGAQEEGDDEDERDPILREIGDSDKWLPVDHRKDDVPGPLPESLKNAILSFLLATTIRDIRMTKGAHGRGGGDHRSMLINVSRFTDIQNAVADLVQLELDQIKEAVRMHGKLPPERASAQSPWIATLERVFHSEFQLAGEEWSLVLDALHDAMAPVVVRPVNQSTRKDKLDYGIVKGPPGVRVIAVGGNSLSRGLTLEGLSTSYFLRNSRAYDTLLQMGRWFGYRDGFDDLCRVWLTKEAEGWYRYITRATVELKSDFQSMKRRKATPREFGLRVRAHPDTLLITARNKMTTGLDVEEEWDISLTGRMVETTRLFNDRRRNEANFEALDNFIAAIGGAEAASVSPHKGALIWTGVPASHIADLLYDRFAVHPLNFDFQGDSIANFLRDAAGRDDPELATWTVALPTDGKAKDTQDRERLVTFKSLPDARIIATSRAVKDTGMSLLVSGRSSRVGGRPDLRHAFTPDEWKNFNSGEALPEADLRRQMRAPLLVIYPMQGKDDAGVYKDGLLLPALALHFPGEESEGRRLLVRYRLNKVAQEQMFFRDEDEDGEVEVDDDVDD